MSAVMHTDPNRAFSYAVLASIVLHALLLFGFSHRNAAKRPAPPTPIFARLVQPPVVEPVPVAPQSEPVKPQAPAKPAAPKAAAKPKPVLKPAPEPSIVEAAPAPAYPAPSEAPPAAMSPAVASVPPVAPEPPVIARTDPVPARAAPSAETMDPGSLAQYRLQLISIARNYKRYPRVAIDNNWEGDVVVRMVVGANGGISALNVKTSSGHEVLDQQAVEMFKKAKPLVEIPPALRGKEFALELRAIYNLRDRDSG